MNDRFFLCYFETTRRCNLQCKYCMARLPAPPAGDELTTAEAKALVLDEIAKVSTRAAVAFSGGEHLLRPDALELIGHAASLGVWSFLNTNGRQLERDGVVPEILRAAQGRAIFVLPLNSVDAGLNRSSRDDDTSTVLRVAEKCRREGAEYFFLLTISHENLPTLDRTVKFLKNNRVPMLRAPFVPRGAGSRFPDLFFDREDMRTRIHPALTANPLAYISFTPFFASPGRMAELWAQSGVRIEGLGCQAGRSFAAVGAEGGVAPCVQLLDSGCMRNNVRDRPLSAVIREDPVFEALRCRDGLQGRCGRCRYRGTCGGCRALAYYRSGDILAEDPTCFFEPEDETTVSGLEEAQTAGLFKFAEFIQYNRPWNSLFL
jgi:radical SAM protein with 4Fe4S-binding SPASM domain